MAAELETRIGFLLPAMSAPPARAALQEV
jgi:hypothetical protein